MRFFALLVLPLSLAACGDLESLDGDELGTGATALSSKTAQLYACRGYGTAAGQNVWLYMIGSRIILTHDVGFSDASRSGGDYDPTYRPRTRTQVIRYKVGQWLNAPDTQFSSVYVIADSSMPSGGTSLRSGDKGGLVTIETQGGPYRASSYVCTRETATPTRTRVHLADVAMQYLGRYSGTATVTYVELRRDGTYEAKIGSQVERGRFTSTSTAFPLQYSLVSSAGVQWTGTISGWDGRLALSRGRLAETVNGATDSELLCDASSGNWTDDDAGGNGTYCICAAPKVLIWSSGGCTN